MSINDDETNLLREALVDLAIILKKNNELINENNELRKKMEDQEAILEKINIIRRNNNG